MRTTEHDFFALECLCGDCLSDNNDDYDKWRDNQDY